MTMVMEHPHREPTQADLEKALCLDQSALFDSIDPRDHEIARRYCAQCPVFLACVFRLRQAMELTEVQGCGPQGTWAGKLFGRKGWVDEEE